MDTNATTDDDVKAIKKLGEEFFAGVNAEDLDRRIGNDASRYSLHTVIA